MNTISIDEYSDPRLDIFARMSEPQLRRIYEPDEGIFIAESPMVIERALDAGYVPLSVLTCKEALNGHGKEIIERICKIYPDAPVYVGSSEALAGIRGYQLTRGVFCAMKRHPLPDAAEILINGTLGNVSNGKETAGSPGRIVLLYDVENPSNVGAIFRSAAAMFMDAVLLTHDCSDPLYRRAARVSVGTVFNIPWTYTDGIDILKEYGYKTAAMALCNDSISVSDERLKNEERLVIVMGNEGFGLPEDIIDKCDYVVKIPMAEGVDSLNVAAASAVAFYAINSRS